MNRRFEWSGRSEIVDTWRKRSRIVGLLVLFMQAIASLCEARMCESLSDMSLDAQLDLTTSLAVSLVWVSAENLSQTPVGDIQFEMDSRADSLGCSARQIRSVKQVADERMKEVCSELEITVTEMTNRERERRINLEPFLKSSAPSKAGKIPQEKWDEIWGDDGDSFDHLNSAIRKISSMVLERTSPTQGKSGMSDERQRRIKANLVSMCTPLPKCVARCESARTSLCALNGSLWPLQERFPFDTSPPILNVW
jgi:hypothetical protein